MQVVLPPLQEAVTFVVPFFTPVTWPLPSTVATAALAVDQLTPLTPETFSEKDSFTASVMSSRFSEAEVEVVVEPPEVAPLPSLLTRTMHSALSLPRVTVIFVVPFFTPVTTPALLT